MIRSTSRLIALSAAAILAGSALCPVEASTTRTATFLVSLTITSDCEISTNPLSFGSSGVIQTNIAVSTTLTVTCSNTTPYNIGLDAGTVTGSTVAARLLSSGTANVSFQLYEDSGHTTVWGNTIGTNTLTGTGTGAAQSLTVYGQVPTQTTPAAGTYSSTVTMSVTF